MVNRIFSILGLSISSAIVLAIIYWGVNLSNLKVEKLPVIKALDSNIRQKPDNELETKSRDLAVNKIISETQISDSEEEITLAPATSSLSQDEASVVILPDTGSLDLSEAIEEALKKVLNEEMLNEYEIEKKYEYKLIFNESANKKVIEEFYLRLLLNFEEKLTDLPYFVENIKIDGKEYYRLILTGFESKMEVNELQFFLSENGISSEVSTK